MNTAKPLIDTVETRKQIGFPSKQEAWCESPANFDEHSLRIAGHPVMEDWEQNYMDMLAAIAASKGGAVLELGYGLGLSATAIQAHPIDSHFVVECHPGVIQRCISDFKPAFDTGRMHMLSGFWQDVTPILADGSFDGILFDTYPLREEEIHGNHFWFFKEAFRLLKPGGVLTYYSDEILDLSPTHIDKLVEAGFEKEHITFEVCQVTPPEDCEYWQHDTIVAPIIRKPL
jgi:guanidinoacetate N-methyltransferase